jgi:hypothetical protein
MALKKLISVEGALTVQTPYGNFEDGRKNVVVDAYIKVVEITSTKEKTAAKVVFSDSKLKLEKQYLFTPDMDGGNFIKQAYEYLKALPEFAGAVNC